MADEETRECPFCRETIKAEARLCKHCGSRLSPRAPAHEGVCPFCKEEIHPDAIRCKHCRSNLVADEPDVGRVAAGGGGCGCGCGGGGGGGGGAMAARGAPQRVRRSSALREAGSFPDPECFHDCYWHCVDTIGDPQQCWIACAYLCPEATMAPF